MKLSRVKSLAKSRQRITVTEGQAITLLTLLDIPAKGRIAHHIRKGRIGRALSLCAMARISLWQKIWCGPSSMMLDQVSTLHRLEALLGVQQNGKMKLAAGGGF